MLSVQCVPQYGPCPNVGTGSESDEETIEIAVSGGCGTEETKTVKAWDTKGGFVVVSVAKRGSNQVTAIHVQIEPADKPKQYHSVVLGFACLSNASAAE